MVTPSGYYHQRCSRICLPIQKCKYTFFCKHFFTTLFSWGFGEQWKQSNLIVCIICIYDKMFHNTESFRWKDNDDAECLFVAWLTRSQSVARKCKTRSRHSKGMVNAGFSVFNFALGNQISQRFTRWLFKTDTRNRNRYI